jgi:hypothetical protein
MAAVHPGALATWALQKEEEEEEEELHHQASIYKKKTYKCWCI